MFDIWPGPKFFHSEEKDLNRKYLMNIYQCWVFCAHELKYRQILSTWNTSTFQFQQQDNSD